MRAQKVSRRWAELLVRQALALAHGLALTVWVAAPSSAPAADRPGANNARFRTEFWHGSRRVTPPPVHAAEAPRLPTDAIDNSEVLPLKDSPSVRNSPELEQTEIKWTIGDAKGESPDQTFPSLIREVLPGPGAVRKASLWQVESTSPGGREAPEILPVQPPPREAPPAADLITAAPSGKENPRFWLATLATAFLAGAGFPVLIGIALIRFLRGKNRPLFRVELVGLDNTTASIAWPAPQGQVNGAIQNAAAAARRGAVSLEPPPLESPVEETFVTRRRREQARTAETEQQILEQLFEDNVKLRRQMEESGGEPIT